MGCNSELAYCFCKNHEACEHPCTWDFVWIYHMRTSWNDLCSRLSLGRCFLGVIQVFWADERGRITQDWWRIVERTERNDCDLTFSSTIRGVVCLVSFIIFWTGLQYQKPGKFLMLRPLLLHHFITYELPWSFSKFHCCHFLWCFEHDNLVGITLMKSLILEIMLLPS